MDIEHEPGCPRLQFWDAGEFEAPCWCGEAEPNVDALQNEINEYWMVKVNELITERNNAEQKAADWHKWYNEKDRRTLELQNIIEELEAKISMIEYL